MTELKAEVEEMLSGYYKWLEESTEISEIDGMIALTTPHLDRHNDFLQLVVKRTKDGYALSDDGYILADLEAGGCLINSPRRKAILEETLNGFGVHSTHDELTVFTSAREFPLKKHSLLQAMLAVNDMFYFATPHVRSFFLEDVQSWLGANDVRYIPDSQFPGKSGYAHKFDFAIPSSSDAPERVLKPINNPNKQTALNFIAAWEDVRLRRHSAKAYAVLNNQDKALSPGVVDALHNYQIIPLPWLDRANFAQELAA